jgi:hypothetical protein
MSNVIPLSRRAGPHKARNVKSNPANQKQGDTHILNFVIYCRKPEYNFELVKISPSRDKLRKETVLWNLFMAVMFDYFLGSVGQLLTSLRRCY